MSNPSLKKLICQFTEYRSGVTIKSFSKIPDLLTNVQNVYRTISLLMLVNACDHDAREIIRLNEDAWR